MENIIKNLVEIADYFEKNNKQSEATTIDKIANGLLLVKTAQYVGVQGYAIRNSRCFDNCYRQKRAQKPTTSVHEVWKECHKEYIESIGNDGSKWDKYASQDGLTKTAALDKEQINVFNKRVANSIKQQVQDGSSLQYAITDSLDNYGNIIINDFAHAVSNINKIAANHADDAYLQEKFNIVTQDITKEAQGFFSRLIDTFRGQGGKNTRASEGIATEAQNGIDSIQKKVSKLGEGIKEMREECDLRTKNVEYFEKINKDLTVAQNLTKLKQQLATSKEEFLRIAQQIRYISNGIINSLAAAANMKAQATEFTPTTQMAAIKNLLAANPDVGQKIMNHVFGKGPPPTQPGPIAIVQYINNLTPTQKLGLQDFLRS